MSQIKPPLPPFTHETAAQKVQAAEDAWNTRDPERVAQAYTVDSVWRNRNLVVRGRGEIIAFLTEKWERELDYALRKNVWCFDATRIAVRFQYESRDRDDQWWRSYGNELWEFDEKADTVRVRAQAGSALRGRLRQGRVGSERFVIPRDESLPTGLELGAGWQHCSRPTTEALGPRAWTVTVSLPGRSRSVRRSSKESLVRVVLSVAREATRFSWTIVIRHRPRPRVSRSRKRT